MEGHSGDSSPLGKPTGRPTTSTTPIGDHQSEDTNGFEDMWRVFTDHVYIVSIRRHSPSNIIDICTQFETSPIRAAFVDFSDLPATDKSAIQTNTLLICSM